ncbi:MAG: LysM peptidoglycan-binding domain-containing protein [Chloroflexi bacterium]|nr:LysM peptidoglycan-binding domain-containing protein [Chloroflexota bacterium]
MHPRALALAVLVAFAAFLAAGIMPAFADEGLATWYGPGFQGNRMANGQIYDMNDPTTTAANLFPFGTWLKVTNVANGKTVVVQVRDRGPFKHALDLSYAAFALLDEPKKMQIRVRYEVVPGPGNDNKPPAPTPSPQPAPPAPSPQAPSAPQARQTAAAPTPGQYVVQPGDTLFSIGQRFGVAVQALLELNDISDPNLVRIGEELRLSAGYDGPSRGGSRNSVPRTHEVQPGDTLGGIALQYGLSERALADLNKLDSPDLIVVGQELLLPEDAGSSPSSPAPRFRDYIVQDGDTLLGIAQAHETTLDDILSANDLSNADLLLPGQVLRLP